MEKCGTLIKFMNSIGMVDYYECKNPAKFRVKYKNVINKKEDRTVCGIHYNSIKKWAKKYEKITGNKMELNIKEIK